MNIKQKTYLTLAVSVIVFLAITFLAIPFLLTKIKAASDDLTEQKKQLEILQKEQAGIVRLEENYKKIKPEIEKIDQGFLDPDKVLDFIVALEDVAKKTNNQYEIRVVEKQEAADKKPNTMNFQISLWGSFPDAIRFLVYLENMPYLTEAGTLQIYRASQGRTDKATKPGDIATISNLRVYTNPEKN